MSEVVIPRINGERLWHSLQQLGEIGADSSGGVTRLSLSEEELGARQFIVRLMKDAGLDVRQDEAGNLIGRLEGDGAVQGAVVTGSHIDSVIQAGRFDGPLGVVSGIEALRTIKEQGIRHERPLEVICFTDEEGVRFGAGYFGSRAMAGDWDEAWLELTDFSGITLKEAMERADLKPHKASLAARSREEIKAYVELHIEQGRVLEDRELSVGIATAIYGHRWLEVRLRGRADHAGTTPMKLRRDPLAAAAEAMLAAEQIALQADGVATVGTLQISPGAINVIPGEVLFTVDVRHERLDSLHEMEQAIEAGIARVAGERGLEASIRVIDGADPVQSASPIMDAIGRGCKALEIQEHRMVCGAGHDAVAMNELADIGLILVRSRDGISHHPQEWSSPEDCEAGANVLLYTLIRLSNDIT
ncbi:Zn-dependent hydrolase [Paenibacillus radicis (ex Gao et al. 2016)]|uniref:Zn-dependent hydrolase n=1 Tax=Paenibacillus radicis (ex Gao et al. 2016) TaxID=1737354 RepID=A0A917LZB5_9BACL|nr:Zn-dependent hydrolase [Paenibacillus radicis (ex Gao et al. 2016)]GGG67112.1 Zn-dependent hydrolase [Paenibacillus radicis (ex Gao et al. 2016)]